VSAALEGYLAQRIRAQGPMPFAAFMQTALYHPRHGYYAAGGTRTGWRGDYLTAPELDPAFGALWARGFEQVWEACGRPGLFSIVEIGPGEGGFAQAALESMSGPFADAVRYRLVERSGGNEERQRRLLDRFTKISWHRSIQEVPGADAGCLFANEVLDNLPVHLVERRDGVLLEVCVELGEDGLVSTLRPPSNPELQRFLDLCGVEPAEGHRYEVGLAAISLVAHATTRFQRGASFFVDYGATATELAERPGGSLLCYSSSGSDDLPLQGPGDKDITVHANWTALALALREEGHSVLGPIPQRDVLRALGVDELHAALRTEWDRATAAGEGAAALRALSRRQALTVLSDESGMGGFGVVAGVRGAEAPAFLRR
jgi:SAM-dependent MidA family methyltransferase